MRLARRSQRPRQQSVDSDIVPLLTKISEDIGSVKKALDMHMAAFAIHVESDKALADDVLQLRLKAEHDKGAHRLVRGALNTLTVLGTSAAAFFTGRHHWGH